ncbi:hypothetical protein A8L34_07625 [Bacillus sp. FJAT-27264]|uniref:NADPH-dependent FMN reductase n=1 Tax=Paenibacillus sp. (strain DSM 101736 / FJAT-27264) TaxID=1850362 RepID=UPI000807E8E0|nr:NAD(P)H-dependent oxidoreductase [Bacillus sp. FJAT-27264]OBZ19367.1 hypothetical protein A8L34_07625 [Bacillus sp. FJAT-27264]
MHIAVVVGNPKPFSKTYNISLRLAEAITEHAEHSSLHVTYDVIDLAPHGGSLLSWGDPVAAELNERIARAQAVVFASPTYKATYTGLLKLFADQLPPEALAGKLAIPLLVGAAPHHSLAVELHLRPLLIELGASCPTKGLYVMDSQLDDFGAVANEWVLQNDKWLLNWV